MSLRVAWYGDDFTGSAAVMEVLTFSGYPSVLFLEPPTEGQRALFPDVCGLGIAGTARAHSPEWMETHLPPIFDFLKSLDAPITHYKTCSTLDSSPTVGSIGRAIELALEHFESPWVPILHAAPAMRRYQAFGHLFAGAPGGVFRLDRHPVMSRHPVTPMDESDVARHLSRQIALPIGLLDLEALATPAESLARLRAEGTQLVSLDTIDERTLEIVGRLLWEGRPLFAVGSQGIEYALTAHWAQSPPPPPMVREADRVIVVSGSVSPVTAGQIEHALQSGFTSVPVDVRAALNNPEAAIEAAVRAARGVECPLLYTARGPDDPSVSRLDDAERERLGETLGRTLARLLRESDARRVVVSGGDTSGAVTRQLGIFALTALAPLAPGAALCRAHSDDPAFDGLEIALKGGQMGGPEYFSQVRRGKP